MWKLGGKNMARLIGDTPTLYGGEAADFLNRMVEPLSKKDKEFKKRYDAARKVSFQNH
jgi:hypothetical protein